MKITINVTSAQLDTLKHVLILERARYLRESLDDTSDTRQGARLLGEDLDAILEQLANK